MFHGPCEPFKNQVAEVLVAVQRDGSYSLGPGQRSEAPAVPQQRASPEGYVLPASVLDIIVRLEERNARLDEEFALTRREELSLRREESSMRREMLDSLARLANSVERIAGGGQPVARRGPTLLTAEEVLADWRNRLAITDDVWAVAMCIVPQLVEHGDVAYRLEDVAARTGLMQERVHDCLRFLQKRACIRQLDIAPNGAPRYELTRP